GVRLLRPSDAEAAALGLGDCTLFLRRRHQLRRVRARNGSGSFWRARIPKIYSRSTDSFSRDDDAVPAIVDRGSRPAGAVPSHAAGVQAVIADEPGRLGAHWIRNSGDIASCGVVAAPTLACTADFFAGSAARIHHDVVSRSVAFHHERASV